jgi:Flp pilus assembly pilin Flp
MNITRILSRFWQNDSGISSVEYALLLSFVAAGIIISADLLSQAVSNEMIEATVLLEGCGNGGGGDGTGGTDGSGQGGTNTC